jgi:CheY-like chemotaxis protein
MIEQHAFGRILILEDDSLRVAWFRQKFSDYQQDITLDVWQAIEWLQENDYTLILLDHDLTEEHYFNYDTEDSSTGYTVAVWLAKNDSFQKDATIIIHSLNFIGAERMLKTLTDAGRDAQHIPFFTLQAEL